MQLPPKVLQHVEDVLRPLAEAWYIWPWRCHVSIIPYWTGFTANLCGNPLTLRCIGYMMMIWTLTKVWGAAWAHSHLWGSQVTIYNEGSCLKETIDRMTYEARHYLRLNSCRYNGWTWQCYIIQQCPNNLPITDTVKRTITKPLIGIWRTSVAI